MTDTHTHLYLPEFEEEGCASAVERALAAGVNRMVFPNVDLDTVAPMLALHEQFPDNTVVAIGLHPTSVDGGWRDSLDKTLELAAERDWAAIGEVGIDLYWDKTFADEQKTVFTEQLHLARDMGLTTIIHCREGLRETLDCIVRAGARKQPLIFHSFTGSSEDASAILEACSDVWFGINGVVTFKNAQPLRDALPIIGLERIVLETDSPYLAPVPHRGKRNETAYLPAIAAKIAETLSVSADEVERITDISAARLFDFN